MGRDRPVRRSAFTQGSGEGEPGAALRTSAGTHGAACEGYTLVPLEYDYAAYEPAAVLVDMDGEVVRRWRVLGTPVKMLPGGHIMAADRSSKGAWDYEGVSLEQRDWDDATVWSFDAWNKNAKGTLEARQHHDFQREGDPVGYYSPGQQAFKAGQTLVLSHEERKAPKISAKTLLDDVIYEVDRHQRLTGFTWRAADHIGQMGFDAAALKDIRTNPGKAANDWLHLNAMSTLGRNRHHRAGDERFAPDNIIINSREACFMAVINRRSGDIVWRLGPDYGAPWPGRVGPIIAAHHAHMIPEGLPGAGNILVFDNGGASCYGGASKGYRHCRNYTRVLEFDPVTLQVIWSYGAPDGADHFMSAAQGGAQRLPNGNTLITASDQGEVREVNRDGEVVWRLRTKALAGGINMPYRAYRVPPEWLPAGADLAGYDAWDRGGCR